MNSDAIISIVLLVAFGAYAVYAVGRVGQPATAKPLCGACRYYAEGACRRYPPTRVYRPNDNGGAGSKYDVTVWPIVRPEIDWCGEHKEVG